MATILRNQILFFLLILSIIIGCSKSNEKQAEDFIKSARTFMSQNKPETAVIEYRNAVDLDPGNPVALFELAEAYIVLNKLETAIRYYNLTIKADEKNIIPHLRLARIYLQTDHLMDSRNEISKIFVFLGIKHHL